MDSFKVFLSLATLVTERKENIYILVCSGLSLIVNWFPALWVLFSLVSSGCKQKLQLSPLSHPVMVLADLHVFNTLVPKLIRNKWTRIEWNPSPYSSIHRLAILKTPANG